MKICIQAGHSGRTSGAIGAPNEMSFNEDISNQVAFELSKRGFTVQRVNADPKPDEIGGDWDLFLAIHYDAVGYKDAAGNLIGGGFVDFPDPATDGATAESQRIAYLLRQEYFGTTHIVNHPERSNINTRKYYMWEKLSAKTPCVLIECGVGMHVPDDHEVLHFNRPLVVEGIVKGICLAFNVPYTIPEPETPDTPTLPPTTPPDASSEVAALLEKVKSIVFGRWTWTGKDGWKNRLAQLKVLLPI